MLSILKKTGSYSKQSEDGFLIVVVLVFGAIFFTLMTGYVGYVATQNQVINQRYTLDQSLEIAEAGLNYYKWYLHRNTHDVASALPSGGVETHVFSHPEEGDIGEYVIAVASTTYCGAVSSIEVTSTGYTYKDPSLTRTVQASFVRPTVAEHSYILDANVWAGADRQIYGPYHSNGGIRMDGTNHSVVSSGKEVWSCAERCPPGTTTAKGVFTTTANANQSLFVFPTAPVSFGSFVNQLNDIAVSARDNGGYHKNASSYYGYLVEFVGNNRIRVREVTDTYNYRDGNGAYERHIISSLGSSEEWTINPSCPVVFIDDKIWLRAEPGKKLDSRVSVVSSDTVILQGNIEYDNPSEDGLLVIGDQDVLVGVDVPTNMTINGIFVAQQGHFGRNYYTQTNLLDPYGAVNHKPFYKRDSLTINGTIVSKGSVGTKWDNGGTYVSGFANRYNSYDRNLVDNPPPLVPNTSSNYRLINWREVK